jgi:thioredoxin 1
MIKEFSKQLLSEEIKKNNIIVLDFHAVWCGPCKSFSSVFNNVATELNSVATFGKINIDEQRDLAIEYKVSSIPTIIILKNGIVMWQHIGTVDAETLKNKINTLLK